jgi:cold shock CspA family protein
MTSDAEPGRIGQATVHRFEPAAGTGAVITDDGVVLPFSADAWRASPLLTLRVGQRVAVTVEGGDEQRIVSAITLVTFPH